MLPAGIPVTGTSACLAGACLNDPDGVLPELRFSLI
jgi:hypothetical protein